MTRAAASWSPVRSAASAAQTTSASTSIGSQAGEAREQPADPILGVRWQARRTVEERRERFPFASASRGPPPGTCRRPAGRAPSTWHPAPVTPRSSSSNSSSSSVGSTCHASSTVRAAARSSSAIAASATSVAAFSTADCHRRLAGDARLWLREWVDRGDGRAGRRETERDVPRRQVAADRIPAVIAGWRDRQGCTWSRPRAESSRSRAVSRASCASRRQPSVWPRQPSSWARRSRHESEAGFSRTASRCASSAASRDPSRSSATARPA